MFNTCTFVISGKASRLGGDTLPLGT